MGDTSDFFDQLKDHSEIKLRIFRRYVRPWAAKLGFKAKARGGNKLWYVDGFAGEGRYREDGSDGSPIIAAKHALRLIEEGGDYALGCINVEIDRARSRKLEEHTREYMARGVTIHSLNDDFSNSIPAIMSIIGQNDPALVFIDPFGLKPLNFQKLRPLLRRPGEVDLFLTFMTSAIPRLMSGNPDIISDAIGTSEWTADTILPVFQANLAREGRFLGVTRFPVRTRHAGPIKYDLILGSRHPDAFELLNDSVVYEEKELDQRWFKEMAQGHFFDLVDQPADRQRLLEAIKDHGRNFPNTTRQEIVRELTVERFGEWHTRDIKKAITGMIEGGRILRRKEGRGRIDTDPLVFV